MYGNEGSLARGAEKRASIGLYARYLRLLKLTRLLRVAFWTIVVLSVLWAVPWFPGGLSEEDYTGSLAFTLLLVGAVLGTGAAVMVLREILRRVEESLMAFNAVYDNTTGLYNRRYFYDRLALECERAQRQGNPFSVLLFRFEPEAVGRKDDMEATLRLLADYLVRETRGSDVVAVLGGNELAVAAVGVDKTMATQLGQRLRRGIETTLRERLGRQPVQPVMLGISEYPANGSNAAALLRLARDSMTEPAPEEAALQESGSQEVA